jgi:hypothetical protein
VVSGEPEGEVPHALGCHGGCAESIKRHPFSGRCTHKCTCRPEKPPSASEERLKQADEHEEAIEALGIPWVLDIYRTTREGLRAAESALAEMTKERDELQISRGAGLTYIAILEKRVEAARQDREKLEKAATEARRALVNVGATHLEILAADRILTALRLPSTCAPSPTPTPIGKSATEDDVELDSPNRWTPSAPTSQEPSK